MPCYWHSFTYGPLLLAFFYGWALLLTFWFTWALLLAFFYGWALLLTFWLTWAFLLTFFYTWVLLKAFYYIWAFTSHPALTWSFAELMTWASTLVYSEAGAPKPATWIRMRLSFYESRSRPIWWHVDGEGDSQKCTKEKARSWLRCRSGGAELLVLDGSALKGSHSPVSRLLPSSNYKSFSPSVLSGLAFLFLFCLGSATDHSSHTSTTILLHYETF